MTIEERITAMLAESRARNKERGLGVRCPTCNAGRGRFCIGGVDGGFVPSCPDRIAAVATEATR